MLVREERKRKKEKKKRREEKGRTELGWWEVLLETKPAAMAMGTMGQGRGLSRRRFRDCRIGCLNPGSWRLNYTKEGGLCVSQGIGHTVKWGFRHVFTGLRGCWFVRVLRKGSSVRRGPETLAAG